MDSIPNSVMSVGVNNIRKAQKAEGTATILAIGTANPPNAMEHANFCDLYFRVTNSEHQVELKNKCEQICKRSMIKKRYFYHDEELLRKHPNMTAYGEPSLNDRQDICVSEVPKLGKEAALKALEEWGQPKSQITHLVFCTSCGVDMPSADFQLAKLLGLSPSVNKYCVYMQGCYAGGTVLRYAKDLAENNKGARVLVVCSEITIISTCGPQNAHLENFIGNFLFGDGAAAMIVGTEPVVGVEKPIFEIVSAKQRVIPNSENNIHLHLREQGLTYYISRDNSKLLSDNVEECIVNIFKSVGMETPSDWNSLFWVPHPGGRAILDELQNKLKLDPKKFRASRHIMWEYGNMISACVHFILDDMRRRSATEGLATYGEGLDWGVLLGFGPGMTVETVLLHSLPPPV